MRLLRLQLPSMLQRWQSCANEDLIEAYNHNSAHAVLCAVPLVSCSCMLWARPRAGSTSQAHPDTKQARVRPREQQWKHTSLVIRPSRKDYSMAAYGGHNDQLGLQIFVTIRRGNEWPPRTCDVRVRYDQTMGDLKAAAARALDVPVEHLQLFRHSKEITAAQDDKTLMELDIHTGFGLQGYDTRVPPLYWPAVKETSEGLVYA